MVNIIAIGAEGKLKEVNLALNKSVIVSSAEMNNGNLPQYGNDGDLYTRWAAENGEVGQWYRIDLGKEYDLTRSEIKWEHKKTVYKYIIEISNDDKEWTLAVDKKNNSDDNQIQKDDLKGKKARYVKVTSTGLDPKAWTSFYNWEIYGLSDEEVVVEKEPVVKWELVLQDDFKGDKIDEKNWKISDGQWAYNNEQQYYSKEEIYLNKEEGCMRIRAQKREYRGKEYTGGHVISTINQLYGKWEVRARMPKTQGLWPAIWMLPEDGSWPPEIDIMELVGHKPNMILQTFHYRDRGHKQSGKAYFGDDFSKDFHTFTAEWTPTKIYFFIDGEHQHTVAHKVPDKPMYLILNVAVGGHLPGNPDETTVFPQYMDIDYVKIYKMVE